MTDNIEYSQCIKQLMEKQYTVGRSFERHPDFWTLLEKTCDHTLTEMDVSYLTDLYANVKELSIRNKLLQILFDYYQYDLKDFFLQAFKRERYLDMRLAAIRGYSNFASETEVNKLMEKFIGILIKRPENTPYNYQEYEYLRSACGLPFLINKYGYSCFVKAYEKVEEQYHAMPDAFKEHYTFDVKGNFIELRTSEETKKMLDDFFAQH